MIVRKYQSLDCEEMAQLFYDTIHTIKLMCRKVTQENLIDISLLFRENLQNGIDRLRNAAYTNSYQNNLI